MADESTAEATALVEARYTNWGQLTSITRLCDGWDNDNFRLRSESGRESVLRRYRVSNQREIEHEVELLTVLTRVQFPTPSLVRSDSKEVLQQAHGSSWLMFYYLADCRYPAADEWPVALELMQRLHIVGLGFRGPALRQRFASLSTKLARAATSSLDQRDLQFLKQVAAEEERLSASLDAEDEQVRWSCVHYDVNPRNVLIDDHGSPWLIDFDECVFAPITVDLAGFLHYWCISDTAKLDLSLAQAVVAAYARLTPLRPAELERLPAEVLRYQLRDCIKYCLEELASTPGFQLRDSSSFLSLRDIHASFHAGALDFSQVVR